MTSSHPVNLERESVPTKTLGAVALGFLALFTCAAILASWTRGLWIDESWSILMGQRDLGLAEAYDQRWQHEVSPPTFYFLSWLLQPLTGDGIFGRRLLNLLPLALASLSFWLIGKRYPSQRAFLYVFAILLLTNGPIFSFFPEHRAYFTIIAACSVLAAIFATVLTKRGRDAAVDPLLLGLAFCASLTVFSLHYIVAFEVGIVVGAMIVAFWTMQLRRWAISLALCTAVAGVPIVILFFWQIPILGLFARTGWIQSSAIDVVGMMLVLVIKSWLPIVLALITLILNIRRTDPTNFYIKRNVRYFITSIFISFLLLLIINSVQPLVVDRYLLAYFPFILASCAAILASAFPIKRMTFVIGLAALLGFFMVEAQRIASNGRWKDTARMIAAIQTECSDTQVIAVPYWRLRPNYAFGSLEVEAWRSGLKQVAKEFKIRYGEVGTKLARSNCPLIFWVEHYYGNPASPHEVIAASGLMVPRDRADRAASRTGSSGFITIVPAR